MIQVIDTLDSSMGIISYSYSMLFTISTLVFIPPILLSFANIMLPFSIYAGGRKDANRMPCIDAYMTMNTTSPPASFDRDPSLLPRPWASHQYHTG